MNSAQHSYIDYKFSKTHKEEKGQGVQEKANRNFKGQRKPYKWDSP